ncbi:Response regulator receiver domain-containing protein [Pseudomonas reinekei]|uniref:Response regulator receiver domain-containing protein n=2 Tax=Pseudomonas reinekei TaxID=395598 RepID=A0A1H0JC13_PSERE|nr:Response regulator receiver domain-containing protein [Pseudomonas reinekei]
MRALFELAWDLIMNSVFIVDDHPVIRLAVRMLLEHEGFKVVGETDNGVDAMQMVRECMPDLVTDVF